MFSFLLICKFLKNFQVKKKFSYILSKPLNLFYVLFIIEYFNRFIKSELKAKTDQSH